MRTRTFIGVLAAAMYAISPPAFSSVFEPSDLVQLDRVGEPKISPDGNRVLYHLRTVDFEKNSARNSIWVAELSGNAKQLVHSGRAAQ